MLASPRLQRTAMAKLDANAPGLNSEQAETVVDSAVIWLCPQYTLWYTANR